MKSSQKWIGILLGACALVGASGCFGVSAKCQSDSDCGPDGVCDAQLQACLEQPPVDAGTWKLAWLSPANGARVGGSVPLKAGFTSTAGAAPAQLSFQVSLSDGGQAGTGVLAKQGDGSYAGTWSPPAENQYEVVASYPNAYSDGGEVVSGKLALVADLTGPTLAFTVSPPKGPFDVEGATDYADPAGGKYANAYRRDEVPTVTVTSANDDVDPASIQVAVTGVDGTDAGSTVTFASFSACDAGTFCVAGPLDLSKPEMKAFRGEFAVQVVGKDLVGNAAEAGTSQTLPVTRWRWSYDTGSTSTTNTASVAIGHDGIAYFGTNDSDGKVYSVYSNGTAKWVDNTGSINTTPSVGAFDGGEELVYIAAQDAGTAVDVFALRGSDGGVATACDEFQGATTGSFSVATLNDTGSPYETAAFVLSSGYMVAVRPLDEDPGKACFVAINVGEPFYVGNTAASISGSGGNFFYGDDNGAIQAYSLTGAGWNPMDGWLATKPGVNTISIALDGSDILGGGPGTGAGGVYGLDESGTAFWSYPADFIGKAAWNLSVADNDDILYADSTPRLVSVHVGSDAGTYVATPGSVQGAPLVGADGLIYTAGSAQLTCWDSNLSPQWSTTAINNVASSPNIDCDRNADGSKRPGAPGILYVGNKSGKLFSVIVDSRGLDTQAPWPKYQHDPRNTGNTATSLSDFACP